MTEVRLETFKANRSSAESHLRVATKLRQRKTRRIGVYKITCSANGMVYIGSSLNISGRFQTHRRQLLNGTHTQKAMVNDFLAFGERMFTFEVVALCRTEAEARCRESALILDFTRDGRCYNLVTSEYRIGVQTLVRTATKRKTLEKRRRSEALRNWMERNGKNPSELAITIGVKETRAHLILAGGMPRFNEVRAISVWTNGEIGKSELLFPNAIHQSGSEA